MNERPFLNLTRRDLIKLAAASAMSFSLPGLAGCASVPKFKPTHHSDGRKLILTNGNIIDVVHGRLMEERAVVIHNGIIESLSGHPPAYTDAIKIDMKNGYLIPGLIDAHCHMTLTSEASVDPLGVGTTMRQVKKNFLQQIAAGVTTVRDMGAFPELLHKHLAMVENSELTGPRVVYCNAFTNIKGGHPDIDPSDVTILSFIAMAFAGNPNLWFENTDDLMEKMQRNIGRKASFIKLTMDDRSVMCGKNAVPFYSEEHWKAISDFARQRHLPLAGHIHTKFGFDRAVRYGIDSMEHSIDSALSDQDILAMAGKKIAIVPTMIVPQMLAAEEAFDEIPKEFRTPYIDGERETRRKFLSASLDRYIDPSIHQRNMTGLENYRKLRCADLYSKGIFLTQPELYFRILHHAPENLRKMKEAGIVIGCGTDAGIPFVYHGTLWREMEMMVRAGFTPPEVLRAATINNARILRIDERIGMIEKSKVADIIVLSENPLLKIEACRTPRTVIQNGRLYENPASWSMVEPAGSKNNLTEQYHLAPKNGRPAQLSTQAGQTAMQRKHSYWKPMKDA